MSNRVRHALLLIFQLSEVSVPQRLFQGVKAPRPKGAFTPFMGEPMTMKTGNRFVLRLQTHPLLDRPEIDMLHVT